MESSILFTFTFLFVFAAIRGNYDDDFCRLDSIKQEEPCNQYGGLCVVAADCPEGRLSDKRGLCPGQQKEGVECCHGVSIRETRCKKRGGECVSPSEWNCTGNFRYDTPSDCEEDQRCCFYTRK